MLATWYKLLPYRILDLLNDKEDIDMDSTKNAIIYIMSIDAEKFVNSNRHIKEEILKHKYSVDSVTELLKHLSSNDEINTLLAE